jgi:hypothetical protein
MAMKNNFEINPQKLSSISRWICLSGYVSIFLAYILLPTDPYLKSNWEWLLHSLIPQSLLIVGFLAFVIVLITPGLLIFLFPELAHGWLQGVNPIVVSSKSWNVMSFGGRFWTLLNAITSFAIGLLIIYKIMIND